MFRHKRKWERAETLVAFSLYCRMPFGRVHKHNPTIIKLAKKMGRTPDALAMKMSNLAWCDPNNPGGLKHGSKLDKAICKAFRDTPDELIYESEQALARLRERAVEAGLELPPDIINMPRGEERERLVRDRVNQGFFRRTVLSAYREKCCITGLEAPALLNASHIIPWRENRARLDPRNGLCLNSLHDRAFDRGLITVQTDGVVIVSADLRAKAETCRESAFILGCDGHKIELPDKFKPAEEFLDYHKHNVFVGA